jgi:hypothetical protein
LHITTRLCARQIRHAVDVVTPRTRTAIPHERGKRFGKFVEAIEQVDQLSDALTAR